MNSVLLVHLQMETLLVPKFFSFYVINRHIFRANFICFFRSFVSLVGFMSKIHCTEQGYSFRILPIRLGRLGDLDQELLLT